jgi:hypothetical protein
MKMKKAILFLSIILASGLVMVTVYNTIVDAKSWGSDIPASIQAAREYYKHVDPRRFYAIIGPPNLLLSLLTIILFWKDGVSLRMYFGASFLLYAAIVILTFTYFIPRDLILFTWPVQDHISKQSPSQRPRVADKSGTWIVPEYCEVAVASVFDTLAPT